MKSRYTTIDAIPSRIPRQLAIELLQNHGELITLNPLVLDYTPVEAPNTAPEHERGCSWYQINQRIQYIPGVGRLGSSKLSFKGCFHDVPLGVHSHVYPPMGIDLRHKYHIKGNQPNEHASNEDRPVEAPAEGLYLRADVEITCNVAVLSFVRKELKAASKTMIERMITKAELIDAGILKAMFNEQGKLVTLNPHDRSHNAYSSRTSKFMEPVSPLCRSPSESAALVPLTTATSRYRAPSMPGMSTSMAIEMPTEVTYNRYGSQPQTGTSSDLPHSEISPYSPVDSASGYGSTCIRREDVHKMSHG